MSKPTLIRTKIDNKFEYRIHKDISVGTKCVYIGPTIKEPYCFSHSHNECRSISGKLYVVKNVNGNRITVTDEKGGTDLPRKNFIKQYKII